jgi:hypothetical protein
MNNQFLKDHLLDFEVVSALGVGVSSGFGFGASWLCSVLAGLSAFVVIPLVTLLVFYVRALYVMRSLRKIEGKD